MLSAEYWLDKLDGETFEAYKRRLKFEALTARADRLERKAADLRAQAAGLL